VRKNILLKFTHSVVCALLVATLVIPLFPYEKEIKAIASVTAEGITNAGIKTVAVVDFTDLQGNVTELGRFLAEELSIALTVLQKGFEVVDRTHLKTLLQEHKLSSTGIIDPQTAKKLGQIAGVEALITGTITAFGDSVRASVKVLNTETAKMIAATSADIAKTKAIEELLAKGIGGGTGKIAVSSQGGMIIPSSQPDKSTIRQSMKQFTFEIRNCILSGQSLTIDMVVINEDRDTTLAINKARIIDDLGSEYNAGSFQLGNRVARGGWSVSNDLTSGVPIKTRIVFDGVSSTFNFIKLFEINCWGGERGDLLVQFRDISVIKR